MSTIKLNFIGKPIPREMEDKETKKQIKYLQIICEDEKGIEYRINVNEVTEKLQVQLKAKEVTYKEITPVENTFRGKKYTYQKIVLPKSLLIESF